MYDALSYVWGNQSDPIAIHCGEGVIEVTKNLHIALLHLRDKINPQVLWIDAICKFLHFLPDTSLDPRR